MLTPTQRRIQELMQAYGMAAPQSPLQQQQREAANLQRRLGIVGEEPIQEPREPGILRVLQALDKPRNALMVGLRGLAEEGTLEGFARGWRQDEVITGRNIMEQLGIQDRTAQGIMGFVFDAVTNPLMYVKPGVAPFVKGLLSGTAQALTKPAATALARGYTAKALNRAALTAEAKRQVKALPGFDKLSEATVRRLTHRAAKLSAVDEYVKAAKELGLGDDAINAMLPKLQRVALQTKSKFDELADVAIPEMSDFLYNNAQQVLKLKDKGMRVFGKQIVDAGTLRGAGANIAQKIQAMPVVGRGMKGLNDGLSKLFNPYHISKLDDLGALGKAGEVTLQKLVSRFSYRKGFADKEVLRRMGVYMDTLKEYTPEQKEQWTRTLSRVLEGVEKIDVLPTALQDMAKEIKSDFAQMAIDEGMTNIIDDYVLHMQKKPGMDGAARFQARMQLLSNLSRQHRKYGNFIDLANVGIDYNTASKTAKNAFRDAMAKEPWVRAYITQGGYKNAAQAMAEWGKFADEMIERALKRGGIPLAKHNIAFMQKHAQLLDGAKDVFEQSAVKAFVHRALRSNRIVANNDLVGSIVAAFGASVTAPTQLNTLASTGKRFVVPRQAFTNLMKQKLDDTPEHRAIGEWMHTMFSSVTDRNVAFVELTPAQAGRFMQDLKFRGVQITAMPEGVVNYMNQAMYGQMEEGMKTLLNVVDGFYRMWKPTVTGLRPDFHIRNLLGSTVNNMYDIGFRAVSPKFHNMAFKVFRNTQPDELIEIGGQKIKTSELHRAVFENAPTTFAGGHATQFGRVSMDYDALVAGQTVLQRAAQHPIQATARAGQVAAEFTEHQLRGVSFLANLDVFMRQGMSFKAAAREAGERVTKFHFDYGALSNVERNLIRRVAPFYTWFRKNLPLQFEQFLNQPAYFTLVDTWNRNVGENMEDIPDWMRMNMAVALPGGEPGIQRAATLGIPQVSLLNITQPGREVLGLMSPLLRVPLEAMTNRRLLTGAPLARYPEEALMANLRNIRDQFGIVRELSGMINPPNWEERTVRPLIPELPIMRGMLREVDVDKARLSRAYQLVRELEEQTVQAKEKGKVIPNITEINMELLEILPERILEQIQRDGEFPDWTFRRNRHLIPQRYREAYEVQRRVQMLTNIISQTPPTLGGR